MTDLRHRTPVPDGKGRPREVGLWYACQSDGQSSDIGTTNLDFEDRHRTSPTEGEIGHRRSERCIGPHKASPRIIRSYQLKASDTRKA